MMVGEKYPACVPVAGWKLELKLENRPGLFLLMNQNLKLPNHTCFYFEFDNRLRSVNPGVKDDIVASDVDFKLFAWNELSGCEKCINLPAFVREQGCAVSLSRN